MWRVIIASLGDNQSLTFFGKCKDIRNWRKLLEVLCKCYSSDLEVAASWDGGWTLGWFSFSGIAIFIVALKEYPASYGRLLWRELVCRWKPLQKFYTRCRHSRVSFMRLRLMLSVFLRLLRALDVAWGWRGVGEVAHFFSLASQCRKYE